MGFWASAVAVAISSPVQEETNRFAHFRAISSDKKSCEIAASMSRLEAFDMQCERSFRVRINGTCLVTWCPPLSKKKQLYIIYTTNISKLFVCFLPGSTWFSARSLRCNPCLSWTHFLHPGYHATVGMGHRSRSFVKISETTEWRLVFELGRTFYGDIYIPRTGLVALLNKVI